MRPVSRIVLALLLLAAVLDHTKHSADATKPIYDGDKLKGGSPDGVPALLGSLVAGTKYSVEVYVKTDNAHAFAKISGGGVELWLDDKIEQKPANSYIMLRQTAALPAAYTKPRGFAKVGSAITGLDGADLVAGINFVTTTRVGKAYDLKTNYCGFVVAELLGKAKATEGPAIALVNQMVDKQVAIPLWKAKWVTAFGDGVPAAVLELKANLLAAFKASVPPPGGAGSPPPSSPGGTPPSSPRGSSPPPSSGRASARSGSPSPRAAKFLQRLQA